MDAERTRELVAVMDRLARGDGAAVVALYEGFGDKVAGAVRAVLRERGLMLVHDEVDGLVLDACFAIAGVAGAWSPTGGAMPWRWARRRIENCVDRLLGQHTVPLDDHLRDLEADSAHPPAARAVASGRDEPPASAMFAALVEVDARCRLLDEALGRADVTPLDREVWFQYALEQCSGNRSPAATVGVMFDLRPPAVRQRVRRCRQRLRRLASDDRRFAPLAGLPLVA